MKQLAAILIFLCSWPALAAQFYKPGNFKAGSAKILVVIHGCLQSAESMAFGTGFNQLAEQNNLLVIYPLNQMGEMGSTKIPFFSDVGPNATKMIWDFFSTARPPNKEVKRL